MRLDHLHYFATICKHGNLTKASEELEVSQPALSNSVRMLEADFGVQLFNRTGKGLNLTEAGETFLFEATLILNKVSQLKRKMDEYADEKPSVNIALPPLASSVIFQHALDEFDTQFNPMEVNIYNYAVPNDPTLIFESDASIELAIVPTVEKFTSDTLAYVELCKIPLVCCVALENPLAIEDMLDLSMLNGKNAALLPDGSYISKIIKNQLKEHGVQLSNCFELDRMSAISRKITEKNAVSFLYQGTYASSSTVLELPLKDEINVCINLLWRKSQKLSDTAKKFLDFIKSYPL